MPTEFRSALLGFNREDVLKYISRKDLEMKAAHEKTRQEINSLSALVANLQADLNDATEKNAVLTESNNSMKARLMEFEAQVESLNATAEKIGKLYLVSKTSAKTILDKAHESSVTIGNETAKNLENIVLTQNALLEIKERLLSSTQEFVSELDELNDSLASAKDKLETNSDDQVKISAEFADIYKRLG